MSNANDSRSNDGYTTAVVRAEAEDLANKKRLLHPNVDQVLSASVSATKAHDKRILVVDDDPDVTYSIKIGIEYASSIKAHYFNSPIDVLSEFRPSVYDLLLVDINMPMMNGFELAEKILQKDINIKICFMSAGEVNMNAVREVHSLRSIGCFIAKPITIDALIERISAELE